MHLIDYIKKKVTIEFAQKYFKMGNGGELSLSILYAAGINIIKIRYYF